MSATETTVMVHTRISKQVKKAITSLATARGVHEHDVINETLEERLLGGSMAYGKKVTKKKATKKAAKK